MKRLINAIRNGKFKYENYLCGGTWRGMNINTMPLFASYGQIGYRVNCTDGSFVGEINYDWEFDKIKIL